MSDFSREIKQWNAIAAGYERKRANLRPISFDFTSKAYSSKGNYNGASTFNSARAKLMADDAVMRSRMTYTAPEKFGTTPTRDSVLKPSADVVKAEAQVQRTEDKIKELGGNAFRSAVGGLVRVADLISRTGYAVRSSSMTYAKENAASNGTSLAEHAENALRPIFDIATMVPRTAINAATGRSEATYSAMWQGFSGRQKTSGHDLLKVAFPEFTSDHKKWTSVLSFGVDVIYDPLSWVTVGQGTVVSGSAKALAAGGAAAVGKKTVARNLMANTIFTTTGRAGGKEALRADLYTRAAKPVIKKSIKADKQLSKEVKSFNKTVAKDKWNTTGARSQYTRVEKAKKVRDEAIAAVDARNLELQSQSFEGMQLAWKAVARKSLGLSSIQAYGKGVNTAGTAGRAAREFKALQTATHEEIVNRFKAPASQESGAWRLTHQEMLDKGNDTFVWKNKAGKEQTFVIPEDYDEFVDKFAEIAFPKTDIAAITKKDRGMRRGMLESTNADSRRFFQAFVEHSGGSSKRIISPYRGAGGPKALMTAKEAIDEMEQSVEGLTAARDRLKAMPGETPAMHQVRIMDEAADVADEKYAGLVEHAKAMQGIAGDAKEALRAADEALASAKALRAGADAQRATAAAEHAEVLARADEWLQAHGLSIGSTEEQIIAALARQDNATATVDQIADRGMGTILTRDSISDTTKAKVLEQIDKMNASVGEVVTSAGGTMTGNKITKLPGMMDDITSMGKELSPDFQRQVNYEIAKAIQEANEATKSMLVADALANDYELAWDMIQNNTNEILNSLFGDTHVQVFTYLNEMGYSVLADTPATLAFLNHMVKLMGDTFTPMSEVLGRATIKTDVKMRDHAAKVSDYKVPSEGMEKLRLQVPRTLQNTHNTAMDLFRMGDKTDSTKEGANFQWAPRVSMYDEAVKQTDVETTLNFLVDRLRKLTNGRLPDKPTVRISGYTALVSVSDVVDEWALEALAILRQSHTADTPALGHYTLYDYWAFASSSAKETTPLTHISGAGRSGDKAVIGRAGYLSTRSKVQKKAEKTLQEAGVVNEALDTIPAMDERMVELTSHVHGFLAGRDEIDKVPIANMRAAFRDAVADLFVPDLKKVADLETNFEVIEPMELMKSLGAHVQLLSDTTANIDTAAQVALASEVWGRATKIRQMNESIMLFNLHNTLVEALGAEKAAARIVEIIKTRPNIKQLMGDAHTLGTTNGNSGMRTPPSNALDDARQALSNELAAKKQAVSNAEDKLLADETLVADAAKKQQEAAQLSKSTDEAAEAANKAIVDVEATKANVETATAPEPVPNQPGGYTTPELNEAAIAEIDDLIDELLSKINIEKINEHISIAQDTMNQGMAEYAQLMKEAANSFDVNTRYMLKFAGIPIMPVATAHSPMAAYAGMVAMKESQGVVSNWLKSDSAVFKGVKWLNDMARRPGSAHDGTLHQMRLSVANAAQNTIYLNHKAISATYARYKTKAALTTDVKTFWDGGAVDVPEGLLPFVDRLQGIQNTLFARGVRGSKVMPEKDMWGIPERAKHAKAMREQAGVLNEMMPRPYRLPEGVLSGDRRFDPNLTAGEPWSREWLIALSKELDKSVPNHPLAARNIERLNMSAFDDAAQRALANMQNETMLADSMFDAFAFKYTPEHVEVLNAGRSDKTKYVPLKDVVKTSSVYDIDGLYVAQDFGNEMARVMAYYQELVTGQVTNQNYRLFDQINNHWKAMVTAWGIPRYHIGNIMSDGFLSMIDGVGVGSYKKATAVMKDGYIKFRTQAADPRYADTMVRPNVGMEDVIDPKAVGELTAQAPGKIISSVRINGKRVNITAEDYYKAYSDMGLGENQIKGNLAETQTGGSATAKAYRQGMDFVLDWSSTREDYFRIAHFIHAVENEALIPGRSQQEVFKAARDRVIKYHFDYGDITEVERLSFGRVMPFYKWTRNIVPLSMTMLVTNPKAYIINNAANRAMGEMMYPTQEDANGNVIPVQYVTPEWVGQQNSVPIGHYTDPDGNEQARYAVLNLPMDQALANWVMPFLDPFLDPTKTTKEKAFTSAKAGLTSVLGSSGPLTGAVVEAATGKSPAQGGEVYDASMSGWLTDTLASYVPAWTPYVGQMWSQHRKDDKTNRTSGAWDADVIGGLIRERTTTEGGTLRDLSWNNPDGPAARLKKQLDNESKLWMARNFPDVAPTSEEGKKILHDFFVERGVVSK